MSSNSKYDVSRPFYRINIRIHLSMRHVQSSRRSLFEKVEDHVKHLTVGGE